MIEPITTVYRGTEYSSRLEARWAMFFTTLGLNFIYEPNGEHTAPDFKIVPTTVDPYTLEVKPAGVTESYLTYIRRKGVDYMGVGGFFRNEQPVIRRVGDCIPIEFKSFFMEDGFKDLLVIQAYTAARTHRFDLA